MVRLGVFTHDSVKIANLIASQTADHTGPSATRWPTCDHPTRRPTWCRSTRDPEHTSWLSPLPLPWLTRHALQDRGPTGSVGESGEAEQMKIITRLSEDY